MVFWKEKNFYVDLFMVQAHPMPICLIYQIKKKTKPFTTFTSNNRVICSLKLAEMYVKFQAQMCILVASCWPSRQVWQEPFLHVSRLLSASRWKNAIKTTIKLYLCGENEYMCYVSGTCKSINKKSFQVTTVSSFTVHNRWLTAIKKNHCQKYLSDLAVQ